MPTRRSSAATSPCSCPSPSSPSTTATSRATSARASPRSSARFARSTAAARTAPSSPWSWPSARPAWATGGSSPASSATSPSSRAPSRSGSGCSPSSRPNAPCSTACSTTPRWASASSTTSCATSGSTPPSPSSTACRSRHHLGRTMPEVLPRMSPELFDAFRRVLRTGSSIVNKEFRGETPRTPGRPRYWLCSFYPVKTPDGAVLGAGAVVTDIDDRKRMEEALKEADQRKDQFLAMLAHELRNPLAPISNAVQIMKVAGPERPQLRLVGQGHRGPGQAHDADGRRPARRLADHPRQGRAPEGAGRPGGGGRPGRRGQPALDRGLSSPPDRHLARASRAPGGRPGAAGAGALQPAEQRRQVHRRGGRDRACPPSSRGGRS